MKRVLSLVLGALLLTGCPVENNKTPVSDTGVKKATAKIKVGSDGLTTEQRNIQDRLQMDNKVGSIKHLYIISAYSGQTIIYSTVVGKVTSSGKRLTPKTITGKHRRSIYDEQPNPQGMKVKIGSNYFRTNEVIQDDGTYGSSIEYLYWTDVQGRYHQQYITGGMILHISDQPVRVKNVVINMEIDPITPAVNTEQD